MLEQLLQWDTQLFLLINKEGGNTFFDFLMPILRHKLTWIPLYIIFLLVFYNLFALKNTAYILLFTVAIIIIGNTLLADSAKQGFKRLRPCQEPQLKEKMIERVGCGGKYGYFSAHATNHFAMALFFALILKKRFRWVTFALLFWATAIAYAQVYVGKHYPFDVITGAVVGSMLAMGAFWLLKKSVKGIQV